MTINDAHVHMGYWHNRAQSQHALYYSPAQILAHINLSCINRFCVSSTSVFEESLAFVQDEHREMEQIAEGRCYHFLWMRDVWFDTDPCLDQVDQDIPFVGLKLHNEESEWIAAPERFNRILAIAKERRWVVQVHTGNGKSDAVFYLPFCSAFPDVRFNLSHSRPVQSAIQVATMCPNVFLDCSFASEETIKSLVDADLSKRLMFGTDFPITNEFGIDDFSSYVSERSSLIRRLAGDHAKDILSENLLSFLNLKSKSH
jgi:predicted TIM-barrel fold metal-dependent hydrolase